jgi:hypothetical protein
MPEDFSKNHFYFADEEGKKKYTGVTTILGVIAKPALIGWAANMAVDHLLANPTDFEGARKAHTKKKEAAGTHGTDTHALVEDYVKHCLRLEGKPVLDMLKMEEEWKPIRPVIDWAFAEVDHFLFSERPMADIETYIAGTADFGYVGKDTKRYMSDFKTSSGIYYEMYLQTAEYQHLAQVNGDAPYDGRSVVRLGKDGAFEVQVRYDYETDLEAFNAALTLYRAQQTYIKPKKY